MILNRNEISKLFDFLLNNIKGRIEDELFNVDTLILLRKIMKDKENEVYFDLSKEQEKEIIDVFLNENCIFDDNTLSFIVTNKRCINVAIERDINSVDYVRFFSFELKEKTIKLALEKGYVLNSKSPAFLRNNYEVALNSIKINASSADYVNWDCMDANEQAVLVNEAVKDGYILSERSSALLKNNPSIIFNSIALDKNSLLYADHSFTYNPEVFKRFIVSDNNYYSIDVMEKMPLSYYGDAKVMKSVLPLFMLYGINDEEFVSKFDNDSDLDTFIDRLSSLYSMAINKVPKISELNELFRCIAVKNGSSIESDEIINDFKNALYKFFIPRMDNKIVRDKVVLFKQKKALRELYKVNDKEIRLFLDDIVNKYKKYFDVFTLNKMIDKIILFDFSSIGACDKFFDSNSRFFEYEKSLKTKEIIKNLNDNTKKYTDKELSMYKDYISYKDDKYYYSGPNFTRKVEEKCKSLLSKDKFFKEMYNDIMNKANTIQVDDSLTDDVKDTFQFLLLDNQELDGSSETLPFTDEYYEFDKNAYNKLFTLKNFLVSDVFDDGCIEPSNVIDDEAYKALCDYVINNNLLFLLMAMQKAEVELNWFDISENTVIDVMNSMKELVRISKLNNIALNFENIDVLLDYVDSNEQKFSENNNSVISLALRLNDNRGN